MAKSQTQQPTEPVVGEENRVIPWRSWAVLIVVGGLFSVTWLVQPETTTGFWLARVSVVFALILVGMLPHRRGILPFDPPLFLATAVLMLYVLAPALQTQFVLGGPVSIAAEDWADSIRQADWNLTWEATRRAVGSHAEWLILRFVLLCLILSAGLGLWMDRTNSAVLDKTPSWKVALAIGSGAALLNLARHTSLFSALPPILADQLLAVLPVIACCSLACLLIAWRRHQPTAFLAFLGLAPLAAASFLPFSIKGLGWALVVDMVIVVWSLRGRARLTALALLACMPLAFMMVMAAARPAQTQLNSAHWLIRQLAQKIVYRQAETVYCLIFVEKKHAMTEFTLSGSGYFLAGLVPKGLWPEKPSLSRGDAYARDYCGWPQYEIEFSHHSASITLLGEPLIQAGPGALVVAQAVIAVVLVAASLALRSGRVILMASALAIMPWVVDFDQHFALWLANIVKFLLVAVVTSLLVWRTSPADHPR